MNTYETESIIMFYRMNQPLVIPKPQMNPTPMLTEAPKQLQTPFRDLCTFHLWIQTMNHKPEPLLASSATSRYTPSNLLAPLTAWYQ